MLRRVSASFRALFRRTLVEREMQAEMQYHVEQTVERLMARGWSLEAARAEARREFGNVAYLHDEARDARGVVLVEQAARDVRYALRALRRQPLFAAAIVMTLALGLGVNAAMFAILDRTFLRAPRYLVDPDRVHRVYFSWNGSEGRRITERLMEYPRYSAILKWSRSTSDVAAVAYRPVAVGEGVATRELTIAAVSASFFGFFDAKPQLGRFFQAREDSIPAGERVAVLSDAHWRTEYGGRRDVLGARITIGTAQYTIIGVAPPGFEGITDQRAPVAFVPVTAFGATLRPTYYRRLQWSWLQILVRRKPGVTPTELSADLSNAFLQAWNEEFAGSPRTWTPPTVAKPAAVAAPVQLARGPMAGPESRVMMWVAGVALIVLLIACANVANLLLARALRRKREIAIRRAIGGSRARLIQQMLIETLVLSALGALVGLAGAAVASASVRSLFLDTADSWSIVSDARTILFAIALTLATAVVAGFVPALHTGDDLATSLKAGSRDTAYRRSRGRVVLLVLQTTLSVVLLIGAGVFVRSLRNVRAMRLGFDADSLVFVWTTMRGTRLNAVELDALNDRLIASARALPSVVSTSPVTTIPFAGGERRTLYVPGIDSAQQLGRFQLQFGSPEYFTTLGTRILRGRGLQATDRADTPPIVVVSEAMAKVLWKDQDPIGKCFRVGGATSPCMTVVGVAENIRTLDFTSDDQFTYYMPAPQYAAQFGPSDGVALLVRVRQRPSAVGGALRDALQREMPGDSYISVQPLREFVDPAMRSWSAGARMFLGLGSLALVLAAIGLYAVIAFAVAQRTPELGIRIALGAHAGDVVRLVIGDGVRVTLVGVAIGIGIALTGASALTALLYHVSARDPLIYAGVAATLIVVGILASAIPAARAARVDPNVALRTE
jgi:predicted permease